MAHFDAYRNYAYSICFTAGIFKDCSIRLYLRECIRIKFEPTFEAVVNSGLAEDRILIRCGDYSGEMKRE